MDVDFSSQDYFRNPAAAIAKLQSAGPVVEVRFPILGRIWTTTTEEMANRVLKDSRTFSMRRDDGNIAGVRWWMPGIVRTLANHMLSMDEPDHRRLRDIVDEAFRRRAILAMEPRILAIADELADGLRAGHTGRPRRTLRAPAAARGHLRAARTADCRPSEVHGLGCWLHALHGHHRFS